MSLALLDVWGDSCGFFCSVPDLFQTVQRAEFWEGYFAGV